MDLVLQYPVNPVPHHQGLGAGVYVNVAGTQAKGLQYDRVDQPDGRWFLGAAQQLFQ